MHVQLLLRALDLRVEVEPFFRYCLCVKTTLLYIHLQYQEWKSARRNHLMQFIHALWTHGPAVIPLYLPRKNKSKPQGIGSSTLPLTNGFSQPMCAQPPLKHELLGHSPLASMWEAKDLVLLLQQQQLKAKARAVIPWEMIIPSYCRERAFGSKEISSWWSFHGSGTKVFLLTQTIQHRLRSEEQICPLLQ